MPFFGAGPLLKTLGVPRVLKWDRLMRTRITSSLEPSRSRTVYLSPNAKTANHAGQYPRQVFQGRKTTIAGGKCVASDRPTVPLRPPNPDSPDNNPDRQDDAQEQSGQPVQLQSCPGCCPGCGESPLKGSVTIAIAAMVPPGGSSSTWYARLTMPVACARRHHRLC